MEILLLGVGSIDRGVHLNTRDPLRLNVGFLLHQSVGFSRKFEFDHPSVKVAGEVEVAALHGALHLTRTAQGLYTEGRLQAQLPLECVRCLKTHIQTLKIDIGELFVFPPERAVDPLLVIPESGILDLNPLLREHVLLDLPMRPLCRQDCKGLCPVCGNDLNEEACSHPVSTIDPRLAALKSLLTE